MNSKTRGFIGAVALFSFLLSTLSVSAQHGRVKASSKYVTKEVSVGSFDKIELQGSLTLVYTQSAAAKPSVKVYGSDNIVDLVECNVSGNHLSVKFKSGVNIDFGKDGKLKVLVSTPSLNDMRLQGSGDIFLKGKVKSTNLYLTLQGSGDIVADDIECTGELSANLQGSGDLNIEKGVAMGNAKVALNDSGDLNVNYLKAKDASAILQGSGDLKIKAADVTGNVAASLQGSGDLDFLGINGNSVKAQLQGSGDMRLTGKTKCAVLSLQNSGDLNAAGLNAEDVEARVNGSGDIYCSVSGVLKSAISGSGDVGYKGNPRDIQSTGKTKPHRM